MAARDEGVLCDRQLGGLAARALGLGGVMFEEGGKLGPHQVGGVVGDVAGDQQTFAARREQQRAVARSVARRRHHRERGRRRGEERALALDGFDTSGFMHGQHAAAYELEALRVRLGAKPVVELGP